MVLIKKPELSSCLTDTHHCLTEREFQTLWAEQLGRGPHVGLGKRLREQVHPPSHPRISSL